MQDVLGLLIEKFKEKYSKNFHIPKFLVLRNCMKCIYTKFTSSTYLFHSQNSYSLKYSLSKKKKKEIKTLQNIRTSKSLFPFSKSKKKRKKISHDTRTKFSSHLHSASQKISIPRKNPFKERSDPLLG